MKCLLLSSFIVAFVVTIPASAKIKDEHKDFVKDNKEFVKDIEKHQSLTVPVDKKPHYTWKATSKWEGSQKSIDELKDLYGERADRIVCENQEDGKTGATFNSEYAGSTTPEPLVPIPDEFDARKEWPLCEKIMNNFDFYHQGGCGSCWAVSTAAVLSDRLCVAMAKEYKKVKEDLHISAEDVMMCADKNLKDVCDGGNAYNVFTYFYKEGAVTGGSHESKTGCKWYRFAKEDKKEKLAPNCEKTCKGNQTYEKEKYFVESHERLNGTEPGRVEKMQREIMKNGPIQAAFRGYVDFFFYASGIYVHVDEKHKSMHSVRILGWDQKFDENNVTMPFWIVANSWGKEWGENGTFRIARGQDEGGIETLNINYGKARLPPPDIFDY